MHKNKKVAHVKNGCSIVEILDKEELPMGLCQKNGDINSVNTRFKNWLSHRTIPNSRVYGELLIKATEHSFSALMLQSMSISLTDTYWLKPLDLQLTWEDVNYYNALFSNDVGKAIIHHNNFLDIEKPHPTFTTDGMLEKTWVLVDNQPYLVKFARDNKQTIGEVYATRVANLLGVEHVPYNHLTIGNRQACICPCCVKDDNTDMVYAMQYKWRENCGDRELYDVLAKEDVVNLDKMIVFDALLCQFDRHFYNFAFSNGKMLPLYDSGRCLIPTLDSMPFCRKRKSQLNLVNTVPFEIPKLSILRDIYHEVCDEFDSRIWGEAELAIEMGYLDVLEWADKIS